MLHSYNLSQWQVNGSKAVVYQVWGTKETNSVDLYGKI